MCPGEKFKLTIVIPARLQSTRIKRKPLLEINGKTLVRNAVDTAKKCRYQDSIVITSESDEVLSLFQFEDKIMRVITSEKPLTGTERITELLEVVDSEYYMLLPCDIYAIDEMVLDYMFEFVLKNKIDLGCLVIPVKEEELYSNDDVKMLLDKDDYALGFIRKIPAEVFSKYEIGTILVKQLGVYIYKKVVLEKFKCNGYDLFEIINNNESYRFIHNSERIRAISTSPDLFAVNSNDDIFKIKEAGFHVQYSKWDS